MREPRFTKGIGIAWKLLAAFALVLLVVIGMVSLMVHQAAVREVRVFMLGRGMTDTDRLTHELIAYYQGRGSWQDVEDLFVSPGAGHRPEHMGRMTHNDLVGSLTLADALGRVVYDTHDEISSDLVLADHASAIPLEIAGEIVGYLLVHDGGTSGSEAGLINRVDRGIWLAALAAGMVALLVGGGLVIGLLRPVRELTHAASALARGDLSRRVSVRSRDEIGELSIAFNQMAASLEKAEARRRELTADIAHELRNPLAVMQAQIEAIMDGVHASTRENLLPVHEQSRLLNRLVEDLRTLSLADAGQLELDFVRTDLDGMVRRMIDSYQAQAQAAGVELKLNPGHTSPVKVNVDPARMEQILGNLISNALRHTPRDGEIEVTYQLEDGSDIISIEVIDSGEGIPDEALSHVFERFYRADRSRTRLAGGTGLGLAITRKLVEAHGGTIAVANLPGRGAVFTIELPVV